MTLKEPTPQRDIAKRIVGTPEFWFLPPGFNEEAVDNVQTDGVNDVIVLTKDDSTLCFNLLAETRGGNLPNKLNEDALLLLPMGEGRGLYAILDGASSQKEIDGLIQYGITGAFYASHITSIGFPQSAEYTELCSRPTLTAADVVKTINNWLNKEFQKVNGLSYDDVLSIPGMAATFALVDAKSKQISIAHVADSVACAIYKDGRIVPLTESQNEKFDAETMKLVTQLAEEYGCSFGAVQKIPEAKQRIKEQIGGSFRKKINTENGCGILNGMPELVANGLVQENSIPITDDLDAVLIFSDGVLLPYLDKQNTIEISLSLLVKVAMQMNMIGYNFVVTGAQHLINDPEFDRIPRLKDQDDASIIKLLFN